MKFKLFLPLFLLTIISTLNSCAPDDTVENPTTNYSSKNTVDYTYTSVELETLNSINDYRVSIGLAPLKKENLLSLVSAEHDQYMITNKVVSHEGFDKRYQTIMNSLGAIKVGENIAYSNSTVTSKGIVTAWLASPEHKKNIEGDYTHFGISIKENQITGKKYYTNIFAKI